MCDSDGVVLTPEQQELVDILTPEFVQTALDATYAKLAERWEKLVNATSELNEEMRFGKIGLQDLTYSLIRSDERKDFHKELSEARERMLSLRDLTIRLGKGWSSFNLLANTQEESITQWYDWMENQMWERVSYPDKALDEVWKSQEAQLFEKSGLMVKMAFGLDAD